MYENIGAEERSPQEKELVVLSGRLNEIIENQRASISRIDKVISNILGEIPSSEVPVDYPDVGAGMVGGLNGKLDQLQRLTANLYLLVDRLELIA